MLAQLERVSVKDTPEAALRDGEQLVPTIVKSPVVRPEMFSPKTSE